MAEQSFRNHTKIVPAFHYFILPVLGIDLVRSIYRFVHLFFSWDALFGMLTAMALVLLALLARMFALTVQDRVIRLEERLRLERLLPADLQPRIAELRPAQLISLRFAGDAELPALTRKVLDEKIEDRKAIKQMIESWRPDLLRA